ncbi:MAG: helix-turn-helix domain-containing protein, partial [Natronospirillum sp.]
LLGYHWPGNVRELDNVMTYSHAIGVEDCITLADLPPELRGEAPPDEFQDEVQDTERDRLLTLLQRHRGKRQAVADELGISRATLWRRLKIMGL